MEDISQRLTADDIRDLKNFKYALDQSSIVAITDKNGVITYVNDKFCEISKYSREELIGKTHRMVNSGYHAKSYFKNMWETITDGKIWVGGFRNRAKDGSFYWVKSTIIPFLDESGEPYQYISVRQDITDQKEAEMKVLIDSYHDELTGLRNRRYFNVEMKQWLSDNKKKKGYMALLFLDINRFKNINDTLGHTVGDQLLLSISKRLQQHLHEKAELYRFGGDEFIFILKDYSIDEVNEISNQIVGLFENPFPINKEMHYLSASIGVSLYPKDGEDIDTLVKNADSAMYVAKNRGINPIQFYSMEMYEDLSKTMKLESVLRQAVKEKDFVLHYQPQVDFQTNKIVGVEALIRWEHAILGNIPPLDFIPLAEETGLIIPITEWVVETACWQNKKWQESGLPLVKMAVNISPSLFHIDLVTMIKHILKKTGLHPSYLELEITESIMQEPERNISMLKELKLLGVSISIDDFGTGYSSLAYLRHFPIDNLKIDRSFIEEIQQDNGIIVKTIINMASYLGIDVIAEGIEKNDQLDFLYQLHCMKGQGYLFSRPLPSEEMTNALSRDNINVSEQVG